MFTALIAAAASGSSRAGSSGGGEKDESEPRRLGIGFLAGGSANCPSARPLGRGLMRQGAEIRGGKRNWVGGRSPRSPEVWSLWRGQSWGRGRRAQIKETEWALGTRHGGEGETTWRGSTAAETEELRK